MNRRKFLASAGAAMVAPLALAQGSLRYTDKPIRWVLGFAPGGGTDAMARAIAPKVAERLGTTINIENRPGANGNIAAEMVARAAPDGLTFLYNTSSLVVSPSLYAKVGYDVFGDFEPVSPIANVPLLLVAHPSLPPGNLNEFIAYARANPGKLTYASAGAGNSTHLANLMFQQTFGISATHVPYKGGGPALADLLGGHVNFYMDTANTAIPYVQKKLLKAYATAGSRRLAALPDVPAVAELSPRFDAGSWTGLVAPARTPASIVERMNAAMAAVQKDPSMAPTFDQNAAEIRIGTPAQYRDYLKSEMDRWGSIIRANGIRLEQ